MQKLSLDEIIKLIEQEKTFEAAIEDRSFSIKINKYVPYCCTAIHDGNRVRSEVKAKIALDTYQRWFEEDPFTGAFIASMPITLVGNDSRFEYDLNRRPSECIYQEAWGEQVWKRKLTTKEIQASQLKHENYYKVTHALMTKLEELFGSCVVYDIHSYNHVRWDRNVPLFNIGVENIDTVKYKKTIDHWVGELKKIELPNIPNIVGVNDTFYGRGYNLEYITENFKNTLVLATEVKKVYCDELNGEEFPKIIKLIQQKLKKAILNNANEFSQKLAKWKHVSASKLLDGKIDPIHQMVDQQMFSLLRNFELLAAINPINSNSERSLFFKNKCSESPKFKYKPIKINAYALKQDLHSISVQEIPDVSIRNLYEGVINSYCDKIDLLSTLGTNKFLYNSLRYFGRPSKKDIANAYYLIHLPEIIGEAKRAPSLGVDQAKQEFQKMLDKYGIKCKIEIRKKIISKVMVLNSTRTIVFRDDAKFTRKEIHALAEHEIGVHMFTTLNSSEQKLKIFNLGLPVNTLTQEGLAILSEYLSGNITISRLKKIAHRVIIVDMMCSGANFVDCYNHLIINDIDSDSAFNMVTRIFRGGGFTKDYLYLAGFVKILKYWQNDNDLTPLLVGKTSLDYLTTTEEMINREMIDKPIFITESFKNPKEHKNDVIYEYILSGLKKD